MEEKVLGGGDEHSVLLLADGSRRKVKAAKWW
jgi:hypothetical protein